MPAIAQEEHALIANLWADVVVKPRGLSEGTQHIKLRQRGGGALDVGQSQ